MDVFCERTLAYDGGWQDEALAMVFPSKGIFMDRLALQINSKTPI